jgi:hypothetical protein
MTGGYTQRSLLRRTLGLNATMFKKYLRLIANRR